MRHFRGWCSVPFSEPQALQDERDAYADQPLSELFQSMSYTLDKSKDLANTDAYKNYNTFFDEEFDIDIEFDEYERIEVPDFSHGRRGRFIHDFSIVSFLKNLKYETHILIFYHRTKLELSI